jgi:hypothetical protein
LDRPGTRPGLHQLVTSRRGSMELRPPIGPPQLLRKSGRGDQSRSAKFVRGSVRDFAPRDRPGRRFVGRHPSPGILGSRPVAQPAIQPVSTIHNQPEVNAAAATSALDFNKLLQHCPPRAAASATDLEWVEMSPGATVRCAPCRSTCIFRLQASFRWSVQCRTGAPPSWRCIGNEGVGVLAFMAAVGPRRCQAWLPACPRAIARHARRSSAVMQHAVPHAGADQADGATAAQSAPCADQQRCRWLLLNSTAAKTTKYAVTQERIAEMLVRREASRWRRQIAESRAHSIRRGRSRSRPRRSRASGVRVLLRRQQAYDCILRDWTRGPAARPSAPGVRDWSQYRST